MTLITSVFRLGATPVGRKGKERGGDTPEDLEGARSFVVGLVVRMEGPGGAWGIGRGEEGLERGGGDAERLFIKQGMGISKRPFLLGL